MAQVKGPTILYQGQCVKADFEGTFAFWKDLVVTNPKAGSDLRIWVASFVLKCIPSCIAQIQP